MQKFAARVACVALLLSRSAAADTGSAERVLAYWGGDDRSTARSMATGLSVTGALVAATGGAVLLANTGGNDNRTEVGLGLIAGGTGFALGSVLGLATSPAGEHEKLLATARSGAALDVVERDWQARADHARKLRHVVGVAAFALGALGFAGAAVSASSEEPRSAWTVGLLSFGFAECILGTLAFSQPTTIESSWQTYRRSKDTVSLLPNFAVDAHGARFGLTLVL